MCKKEHKVKGVGYSNHPSPMTITSKTTVSSLKELGIKSRKQ
jgi:hypothetical protein